MRQISLYLNIFGRKSERTYRYLAKLYGQALADQVYKVCEEQKWLNFRGD